MVMSVLAEYMRLKALKEFYDNLSEEDKKKLVSLSEDRLPEKNGQPINYVQCRDPYWRGVSQNIVGDGLYGIGLHVVKYLIRHVNL